MVEIISLIDNISNSKKLCSEHGLSLFVKQGDLSFLIDTGATDKFIENAKQLGIDLLNIDAIIISHNHSDHIGGLASLLEYNKKVKVYIKNSAKSKFYYKFAFLKEYIGESNNLFEKYKDRFVFFDGELEISNSIKLLSSIIKDRKYLCKDKNLLEKKDGKFIPDIFEHELFVVIETNKGLIIVSSCSHNGIVNIINTVKNRFSNKPILSIIGGFHLMGFGIKKLNCSKEYLKEISDIFNSTCEDKIYTCHCTGKKAFEIMKKNIKDKIEYFDTGKKIIIE